MCSFPKSCENLKKQNCVFPKTVLEISVYVKKTNLPIVEVYLCIAITLRMILCRYFSLKLFS